MQLKRIEEYGTVYRRAVDIPLGLILAGGYLLVLLATSQMGVCRDETYYFYAGSRYFQWVKNLWGEIRRGEELKSLTPREIRNYWSYNREHPPLAKLLIGASHSFFTQVWNPFLERLKAKNSNKLSEFWNKLLERLQLLPMTAYRFPGMVWGSLMVLIVYIWGVRVWNRRVGFFAAFALMLLPRFFFHAHLAAFDVPISALWLAVAYAFWRNVQGSLFWGAACGFLFGLALATKHNSWILPFPLAVYWLTQNWNRFRLKILPDGSYQVRFPPLPLAFYSALAFGPLLFISLWPLLWPVYSDGWKQPWFYIVDYVKFHLHHVHYDAYYFGKLYMEPPFPISFPFVMTALTFPLPIVLTALWGLWFGLRQQRIWIHLLWWITWSFRAVWSLVQPLLALLVSSALLLTGAVLGMFWILFKLLELLSKVLPGFLGRKVERGFHLLGEIAEELARDLKEINSWVKEKPQPGEYRPRPVGPADKTVLFWLLNAFVPIAVIALPSTPIFGGTKHWMPAWPFLALFAGLGFERMWVVLQKSPFFVRKFSKSALAFSVGSIVLLPAAIGLIRSHPHQLAYYNTLIGGPRGSANWKMQRTFWAPHTRQLLPRLGQEWKRPVYVDFQDSNAYWPYRENGLLAPHIREWRVRRPGDPAEAILFIHQKWLRNQLYSTISILGAFAPSFGVYLDEVPLVTGWKKRAREPDLSHW